MRTPHDRFFRRVFADPEHAAGELRAVLPPALGARLDWSSLTAAALFAAAKGRRKAGA